MFCYIILEAHPKQRKSRSGQDSHLHDNTDSSSTCSLTTIDEATGLDEDPLIPPDPLRQQTGQSVPSGGIKAEAKGAGWKKKVGSPSNADSQEDYVEISVVTSSGESREGLDGETVPLTSTPAPADKCTCKWYIVVVTLYLN